MTCRVVIGTAGAAPQVIDGASREVDVEGIAQQAYDHAEGVDNLKMPGAYRRKMVRVLTKRAIQAAIDDVQGK
jgi:CO/xanthine dehydrogenase FAD-binding subunit